MYIRKSTHTTLTLTHRDRKSPSDDIRLGAVEYPNFLVGYFNVIKLFDHPFCHTVSPHSVASKRRPTCTCTLILYDTIHVHVHVQQSLFRLFFFSLFLFFSGSPGHFVVALSSVYVVSLQSKSLESWNGFQHFVHVSGL